MLERFIFSARDLKYSSSLVTAGKRISLAFAGYLAVMTNIFDVRDGRNAAHPP